MIPQYYAPTRLFIGDEEQNVGKIISSYGYKKVLFVYGGGSIKKTGLYDVVVKSLEEAEIEFIECPGVEPNPKVSWVRQVLDKKYDFDMILAVGGGSVIDACKNIAVSSMGESDPWDYNSYKAIPNKAKPIGVILTIAAAGSEMSNSCVITNSDTNQKQGFNSDHTRPVFAIMNPKLTYTVSKYQTACGVVDIMMHTLERFICSDKSDLADEFALGLLRTVYKYGIIAYNEPENYDARREIMLASSFSHNGLTNLGKSMSMRCHQFEHVLSGIHDNIAHGAGLAVVWPAYSKWVYKNEVALPKFLRLAYEVFNVEETNNKENDALKGILVLEDYFKSLGMPTRLIDLGICENEIEDLTLKLSHEKKRTIKDIVNLTYPEMLEIFKLMV